MSKNPADNPDLVGRQLGDYEILRRLCKGGMAEVFLAEQHSLKWKVRPLYSIKFNGSFH